MGYFGGYYQILAGILKMQKKKSIFFFFGILLVFANTWDISVVIFFAIFLIRFSLMFHFELYQKEKLIKKSKKSKCQKNRNIKKMNISNKKH